ncbi:MAG: thiamine pyrophosphate-dependent enzyme [Dehalococcoidia bacterium]
MQRAQVAESVARHRGDALIIAGPGATSGTLWAAGHRPGTIYNMEMSYALPMALGVALTRPGQRVVSMEGEGSAIAGLAGLATVARYAPENLCAVVYDNQVYGTGGGEVATATAYGLDVVAVAEACGWDPERMIRIVDVRLLEDWVVKALTEPGPWLLVADVDRVDSQSGQRPTPGIDHVEAAAAFGRTATGRVS